MAGEYPIVLFQGSQPLQGCSHGLHIAAFQVGAAAGPGEEGVAGKNRILADQAHGAGCVTGGVDHVDGQARQVQGIALAIAVGVEQGTGGELFGQHQVGGVQVDLAAGGGIGKMPGNSVQRDFLSQAFSDFIFAIVIEELGLLGGAFIVMLYLWLLIRAGRIAKRCDKHFPAFLVMGIALLLVSQAMLNMMVAVGLFPVTGQPLPLISKGGTSTLINCAYIGMILSVSRYVAEKEEKRRQEEMLANDEKLQVAAQALVLQAREMVQNETDFNNNNSLHTEDFTTDIPNFANPKQEDTL